MARLVIILCGVLLSATAVGGEATRWAELSDEQREVLARHAERWDSLPPERQQRLLRGGSPLGRDGARRAPGG